MFVGFDGRRRAVAVNGVTAVSVVGGGLGPTATAAGAGTGGQEDRLRLGHGLLHLYHEVEIPAEEDVVEWLLGTAVKANTARYYSSTSIVSK